MVADRNSMDLAFVLREAVDSDAERGLAILTFDRQVLYSNAAARAHLRDGTPRAHDPLLPAAIDQWLAAFVARAQSQRQPSAADFHYPSEADRRLRVTAESVYREVGNSLIVLRTSAVSPFPEPTVRRLQSRFHLTLREAQVAAAVAHGHSNAEVAERLGIVEKTVKNVLMGVFAKCAVRNRVELALKIYDAPIAGPGPGANSYEAHT